MIEISKEEYEKLKNIESKYYAISIENSIEIANTITNNAINVNKSSKQKVTEISNINNLVNAFITKSNEIEDKSTKNFESSVQSSVESENIICLIKDLSNTIKKLENIFQSFTNTIDSLTLNNKEISKLVEINGQISIQTNLLSLNAKIEAARANEYGKGFSIVADEVKKLAERSHHSTEDIGKQINKITSMTNEAKQQSDMSSDLIKDTISISTNAIDKLEYLINLASQNKEDSTEVKTIVHNQLQDSNIIQSKISQLLEDTTKAIEGSSKNIDLGKTLLNNLDK